MTNLVALPRIRRGTELLRAEEHARWELSTLKGKLSELSAQSAAGVSIALKLIAEAQRAQEPTAWVGSTARLFYPPDAAAWGLDWEALPIINLAEPRQAARAADKLLRSGAFGLVIVDLPPRSFLPAPLMGRLLRLAETHASALLFLSHKSPHEDSLSSLIALRAQARWIRLDPRELQAELTILKDKCRGPGHRLVEDFDGPLGLR
ncbi:recombinase A [Lujinxingia litoralis]|uniref:Recombinase A n=1 Tax=Lujinxingia litoralis TaxID=2211119 RepID=A0A328C8P1_9DELT|nr:recombinase A [Lujinxingia litoralis]RAL23716.1 recombinase A [Lujinxingia litoralis]